MASRPPDDAVPGSPGSPGSPGRAPTIYDVAAAAGVSHQTVSRYLRGFEGIRPATRERVERAVEQLGYRRNETARLLATSRPYRIAAFTHELGQVGPSRILLGAARAAREAGYVIDVVPLEPDDAGSVERAIRLFDRPDVAGILGLTSTDAVLEAFRSVRFRVASSVHIDDDGGDGGDAGGGGGGGGDAVSATAIALLVDHLWGLGHRSFAHVAGPATWAVARTREAACRAELRRRGADVPEVVEGDWSAESGYDAVAKVDGELVGRAFVCGNDQMAIGVVAALADRGLVVPRDASVTGIDDIPEARYLRPALTTVRLDFEEQGRRQLLDLVARIEGGEPTVWGPDAVELVVRGSTAAPASSSG